MKRDYDEQEAAMYECFYEQHIAYQRGEWAFAMAKLDGFQANTMAAHQWAAARIKQMKEANDE